MRFIKSKVLIPSKILIIYIIIAVKSAVVQKLVLFLVLLFIFQQGILSQKIDSIDNKKHPLLTGRYAIKLGFFVNQKSVRLNVDVGLPSNPIDFGQTLGLRRQENTFDLNLAWRFS